VQAIAHTMNIPADTLEDEIEPYLLREGLIQRTPRGRTITADAWKHLGRKPPEPPPADDDPTQPSLF
jgi:Holliday junction DNA helicase RuvB